MSRNVRTDYTALRNPMHISEVLAETFKRDPRHSNLKAWADSIENQPIPGQMELLFCDEINSEFTYADTDSLHTLETVEVPC